MNLTKNNIYKFSYIDLAYNPGHSWISVHFSKFKSSQEDDGAITKKMAISIANVLLQIIAVMTGNEFDRFILSRPKESIYGQEELTVQYQFTFINNSEPISELLSKWKTVSLLLHFRDWISVRNISEDCIDLYVTLSDKWDYNNYVPDCFTAEASNFLTTLKPMFEEKICKAVNVEPGINASKIFFIDPVHVEEGTPVSGCDAFEFRGIIVE